MPEKIQQKLIEEEMKESYIDYAMSVITARALPDVNDGLKPVHRRILYAMHKAGLQHTKPFRKSARVVGDVLGRYHPHGDIAVYDSLVRMAQNFSLRYPLIQGQGNFGSIDGYPQAAMRYCITEDTLLLTDKGIVPIGNISSKEESNININILSYGGKKNIATKFFNSGKHKIIRIKTKLGYELKGSFNHPLLCWTLSANGTPKIEWKVLKDINKRDIVLLSRKPLFANADLDLVKFFPRGLLRVSDIRLPSKMNKDLAFLLGALVSEGSFHQNKILFNNSDMGFYNKVKSIIFDQFEGINLYERKIAGNCLELCVYHKKAVEFLKNVGLNDVKSFGKEIPFSILQSSKKTASEFLKGLFEGDGSVAFKVDKRHSGKSMELTYDSKSPVLIKQLKILLLNFGIYTSSPYKDKRNGCFKLKITGCYAIKLFKNEIGFFSDRKNDLLSNVDSLNSSRMSKNDFIPLLNKYFRDKYGGQFISRYNIDRYNNLERHYNKLIKFIDSKDKKLIDFLIKSNFLFDTITEKSYLPKELVYSIRVDSSCHSFIANGFVNHNTECRLTPIAEEMLEDIEKDTVKLVPNYDESYKEPIVLPSKIPNLVINGTTGIAVGMVSSIPPHNLREVADAIVALIDNPELKTDGLMQYIKGPDFPTYGIILGREGIRKAYKTGRGKLKVKAKCEFEKDKIIISEIPYQVNKKMLIESIVDLVKDKKIEGIRDIRDESDRKGMRISLELKDNANNEIVLNQLYKHTQLQSTFSVIMTALVAGQPKTMSLRSMLNFFIQHRKRTITRRVQFDLKKAEDRVHILEGLKVALKNIDDVVKDIKGSKDVESAKLLLINNYKLSEIQSQAILEMRLQRLTSLEQNKIEEEFKQLLVFINDMKAILASEERVLDIIKQEILTLKEKYGDERRTVIIEEDVAEIEDEDLIKNEQIIITATKDGYIKQTLLEEYRQQKRGGTGLIATEKKEEDIVEHLFSTKSHSYLLFFTNAGRVYWLKAYKIPKGSRYAKGKAIVNIFNLNEGEKVNAILPISNLEKESYIMFATKSGKVKKTPLKSFSKPRKAGIKAIKLENKDEVVSVKLTPGNLEIIIGSRKGNAVKFNEKDVRVMGRNAYGVRGIRLKEKDAVVGMEIANPEGTLLTVTKNGYGKRTAISDYRLTRRGGKGVRNIKITEKNGEVVGIKTVKDTDDVMFITEKGVVIRTPSNGISIIGRNTQGVRVMKLKETDKVNSLTRIISQIVV